MNKAMEKKKKGEGEREKKYSVIEAPECFMIKRA